VYGHPTGTSGPRGFGVTVGERARRMPCRTSSNPPGHTSGPPFEIHFSLVIGSSSSALSPLPSLGHDYVRATVTYSHD